MEWSRIEPWEYIAVSVASEFRRKFNMIELADIKQNLYEWFLEHPNKLDDWEAIGPKDAKNLIYRSLRNQALEYCQRWKARSVGYEVSDLFYYRPEIVESLLPSILRGEDLEAPRVSIDSPRKPPAPSEGGNMMTLKADVMSAYARLNRDDKFILELRHGQALEYAEIAVAMSLNSEDAARMRHKRAVKKLVIQLGGFKPYLDEDSEKTPNHSE